jgi:hypothetical protein
MPIALCADRALRPGDAWIEDTTRESRGLMTFDDKGELGGGGALIASFQKGVDDEGLSVVLNHRDERLLLNDNGTVIGVEVSVTDVSSTPAATPDSAAPAAAVVKTFRPNNGVIFGSGG